MDAFQEDAFQNDAFQMDVAPPATGGGNRGKKGRRVRMRPLEPEPIRRPDDDDELFALI